MKYITEINSRGKVAVDDTILVKDYPCTAGSHILEGFVPLFGAEAAERLEKAGYSISGKTNVGEFGLDLLGETSYYGVCTENGKLTGAAASLVKSGEVQAALNVDVNGYPRRAAAVSGVDFLLPTYSTVSRYGVVAAACSGEQIGVTAANAAAVAEIMSVIAGHDEKDGTSDMKEKYEYNCNEDLNGAKAGIVKELYDLADSEVKADIDAFAAKLSAKGIAVEFVSLKYAGAAPAAWQILMCAETCNNVSRFDGVKYGYRAGSYKNIDELYTNSRTEAMGFLAKQVILYGSDVLSKGRYEQCYDKAMRVRRLIAEELKGLYGQYRVLVLPAAGKKSFTAEDTADAFKAVFNQSAFTCLANLSGCPAMVCGGVQLMADAFDDNALLSIAGMTEDK